MENDPSVAPSGTDLGPLESRLGELGAEQEQLHNVHPHEASSPVVEAGGLGIRNLVKVGISPAG